MTAPSVSEGDGHDDPAEVQEIQRLRKGARLEINKHG